MEYPIQGLSTPGLPDPGAQRPNHGLKALGRQAEKTSC